MAKVFITEHTKPQLYSGSAAPVAPMPPVAEQTVAITAGSVQSNAFNAKTRMIGVHADAICSIAIDSSPTATANSKRMAANQTEYFEVFPNHKLAVITNT